VKILKLLPLFFLSILFALVLPHFHDQAHADPTFNEFSLPNGDGNNYGITSGPDGNLWFTETNNYSKIGKITPSGTITTYSLPADRISDGITSGPDGNLWFSGGYFIGKITPSGTFTPYFLSGYNTGSSFNNITSGPDGNLWFTETTSIGKITTSGTITHYSLSDVTDNYGITSGPDGNLWFTANNANTNVNKVGKITPSGTITEYSMSGSDPSCISRGITSGPDGNLWFTEECAGTGVTSLIGKITPSGTMTEYTVPNNDVPGQITSGPDGNLWFTEGGNKIGKITPSGTITEYSVSISNVNNGDGITIGPDGNIWFTDHTSSKIGRVNLPPRPPLILIPGIEGSNLTVDQTFYPGIGNCLNPGTNFSYNQGDIAWFDLNKLLTNYAPCGSKYLDVSRLQSDGQTPVYPHVVLKNGSIVDAQIPLLGTNIGYHDTLQYLEGRYTLNTNLFIFAYDWRKDLAGNMTALDNLINQATASAGTTQANIMAHSMGGLVARKYISDSTRAQKINTLVELGTPHAGSIDALAHLLYPGCIKALNLVCIIDGNEVNALVQNFTANFELLPSKLYYTLYPNLYPYNDTMYYGNMLGPLSYDGLHTLLDSYFHKNMTVFNTADSFHSNLDSTYSTSNGVKIYLLAGSGFSTFGQIFDYISPPFADIKTDVRTTNGDGTVPLLSATLNNTSNVFYAKEDHGGLVASGSALYMAYNLLNGQTGLVSGIQTTPFSVNGQTVSVQSPTQLDAYDNSNNHTGKKSDGTYEQNIPGSEYYELGDSKFIYLPSGGQYNIKTTALAAGHFDLKLKNYTNDQLTQQTLFFGVSQTASTAASMNLATTSAVLSVDVNGDGTNVQQISPSYTLTGSSVTDYAPPVTTATLSPTPNANGTYANPVTVTLSATASAGFSVSNTYYTLDSGSQQTYSSALTVSGAGNHTIVYWSVDSAGLTEAHNTKTFTIETATTPTLVQKNLQVNATTATFSSNVTSGNLILVAITQWNSTVSSVTDNHSNVYTRVTAARHANASTDYTQLYYAKNATGGATTVTVTFASGSGNIGIYEYSGIDTNSPLDRVTSSTGSGTAPNGGSLTTAIDNELYFTVGVDDNGNNSAPTAGSGYTLENHQDDSTNNERFYTEDRVSGHGSYATNFTIGTGSNWAVIGASFKPAGPTVGISLRAASSGNNAGGSSTLVINKPTGTTNGDIMVSHVIVNTAGNTITVPTGWTLIKRQDSPSSISTATYWKSAGSSEPASYTWSFSTSGEASGGIASYSGVNTTNPVDASNAQYNSSTSTVSNSGVTTTDINDMLVYATGITVPTTVNVPTGFQEEWSTTSTSSTTSEMSDKIDPTTGATGTVSGSHNGGSNTNITHLIALRPAGTTGSSTPSLVQKNFQTSSNTATFSSDVTSGNLILVAITQWNSTVSSVTDNKGNTYTAVTSAQHANTATDYTQLYYAKNVAAGATTVTVTFSSGVGNIGIYEYSGLSTTSPLDQVTSNTGASTTPNGGTLTTTPDNELYFAVGADDNGNNSTPTAGGGYTVENHQDDSANHERFYTEDRVSAHGSYSTDFTIGASSDWAVIGASFKPSGVTVANLTSGHSETSQSSYTTASISPSANKLVIVTVETRLTGATAPTPTVSGAGGTWTQIATNASADGGRRITMLRDLSASPGSGVLTISYGGTNVDSNAWSVDQFTGTDTSGTHGSGAIVQNQFNTATGTQTGITTTLSALGSSNNMAYGAVRWSDGITVTKGSNFTELVNISVSSNYAFDVEYAKNQTAVNWTWGSESGTSVAMAIEIKAQ